MKKKLLSNNSIVGLLAILFIPASIPVFGLLIPYIAKYAIPYMIDYTNKCLTGALCTICIYSIKVAAWLSFGIWMILFIIVIIGVIAGIIETIFG